MCQLKSFIITKDEIFFDLDNDSHEDLIKQAELDDTTLKPNFVRIEIIPQDNDIFNLDLSNWILQIDQDIIPDWFNKQEAYDRCVPLLKEFFEKRIFINKEKLKLTQGYFYLYNSSAKLYNNSSADLWGNSSANLYNSSAKLYDNSSAKLWGNSSAKLCDNSSAKLYNNSSADLWGNSSAKLYDNSSAKLYDNSSAKLWGNSSAKLYDNSSAKSLPIRRYS